MAAEHDATTSPPLRPTNPAITTFYCQAAIATRSAPLEELIATFPLDGP